MDEGISRDLKPKARHPRGNFWSQVTKKCLHLKQSIFSSFMTERSHKAQRGQDPARKKPVLGDDFNQKDSNHNYGENEFSHYPRKKTGEASEPAF